MRQSQLFPKTRRETPADADNISTALLVRAGFVHKLMAGSYTFQPLGWRVMKKIENIIRQEMTKIGGQEIFMPALQPKELWDKSGRWVKLVGDMYQFQDPSQRDLGLAMTHEETFIDLLGQQSLSYNDLPINLYQFQTKFRHEPRARSGLLRTREFIMKDLYSAHADEAGFRDFYEQVKAAYLKIFQQVGLEAVVTLASGGIFTSDFSHEFQVTCEIGEDTVFICPEGDYAVNEEVLERTGKECPTHKIDLAGHQAVEVGNIFPLGTQFSADLGVLYTDAAGNQQPFWSGSYGIGLARTMGVIVEMNHDKNGIIWPKSVAPYSVHLIALTKTEAEAKRTDKIYQTLVEAGIEVLFDDRAVSAGEKFAAADLIGIPVRVVVSAKTLAADSVEVKERVSQERALVKLDRLPKALN